MTDLEPLQLFRLSCIMLTCPRLLGDSLASTYFFVISGDLITALLIRDLEAGQFSIKTFYERRARRILPALFTVLAATVPFSLLWMFPLELND